jgi:hypothetical protein
MLGAIGEQLGKSKTVLRRLRNSLNPFSRFDFGALSGLSHARAWQAKERRSPETLLPLDPWPIQSTRRNDTL